MVKWYTPQEKPTPATATIIVKYKNRNRTYDILSPDGGMYNPTGVVEKWTFLPSEVNWKDHIIPSFGGLSMIKGTSISVRLVTALLNFGWTHEQILEDIPSINNDDIEAVIEFNKV